MASISSAAEPSITHKPFGEVDGRKVTLYTLTNAKGMKAEIMDLGAIVVRLFAPDRDGTMSDIVLGCKDVNSYMKDSPYFGCIAGRYANRIAKGKFTLDGKEYTLATNNEPNHLHGGNVGFSKRVWTSEGSVVDGDPTVKLTYVSPDGEEGYPGTLTSTVTYQLTKDNGLKLHYTATTDKPTVINLTHHGYWNLAGHASGKTVLDHQVQLMCDRFTPTDATAIPTGEIRKVAGTPFDFTTPHAIGERIGSTDEQMVFGKGYDHNFIINGKPGELRLAARVTEPTSGRVLEVSTTDASVQLYTGNFLDGSFEGKDGVTYQHRTGLCLEPQHYPDSPNQASFPSVVLRPGQTYEKTTIYQLSAK